MHHNARCLPHAKLRGKTLGAREHALLGATQSTCISMREQHRARAYYGTTIIIYYCVWTVDRQFYPPGRWRGLQIRGLTWRTTNVEVSAYRQKRPLPPFLQQASVVGVLLCNGVESALATCSAFTVTLAGNPNSPSCMGCENNYSHKSVLPPSPSNGKIILVVPTQ